MKTQNHPITYAIAFATLAAIGVIAETECDPNDYGYQWESNSKQSCVNRAIAIVKEKTGKDVSDSEKWNVFRNTLERFTAQLDGKKAGSGDVKLRNYTDCTRTNISPPVWEGKVFVCVRSE